MKTKVKLVLKSYEKEAGRYISVIKDVDFDVALYLLGVVVRIEAKNEGNEVVWPNYKKLLEKTYLK